MSDLPNDAFSRNNRSIAFDAPNAVPNTPINHSPARSLGGPMRVSVGGEPETQNAPIEHQAEARATGGVFRATVGADGNVVVQQATVSKGNAAPAPVGSPILNSAVNAQGSKVAAHAITDDSRVRLPNGMEVRVKEAVNAGILARDASGRIFDPNYSQGFSQPAPTNPFDLVDSGNGQAEPQEQQQANSTDNNVEALAEPVENGLSFLVERSSAGDQLNLISSIVDRGEPSENAIAAIASSSGQDPAHVRTFVDGFIGEMTAQAHASVEAATGLPFETFQQWAEENHPAELRKAMMTHATERTTRAYTDLAKGMIGKLDVIAPDHVKDALDTAGIRWHETSGGKIVVNIPGRGQMPVSVALKNGLLTVSRNK